MKVAIIADWLTNYGGAEKVISAFHNIYPDADIYTTMYKPGKMKELGNLENIYTSYLNNFPFLKHQWLLSQMTNAVEMFNLDKYDIVLSSSHSVAKGVITKPDTMHISYCHTPMRYAWEDWDFETRLKKFPKILHSFIRKQIKEIKDWDYCAAQRVDYYIANSNYIASKIKEHYKRESYVIYPPVFSSDFEVVENPSNDYYLAVGRLIPYKKFDLITETFNKLGKKLKIVGIGPDYKKIKTIAKSNVEILGEVSDENLKNLYSNAKALIFPQIEDAGIVPLEAMASGRPVIALNKGGSLDSMKEGVSGLFFNEQNIESLSKAVEDFENMQFDSKKIKDHANKFDIENFKIKIQNHINEKWEEFNNKK